MRKPIASCCQTFAFSVVFLLPFLGAAVPLATAQHRPPRDGGIIQTGASPYSKLRSVNLRDVHWTDGFWADRFQQTCQVTLPRLWQLAADPDQGHALENLKIAAGLAKGEVRGTYWQDAWVYKWLEAASYVYSQTGDDALDQQMDEVIQIIAKAQEPDGYLATQTTLRGLPRFQRNYHHELYTMGHLITAACAHHRITGKTSLLNVARRVADYLHDTFDGGDPMLANCPINPSIIMAAVELYRTTGNKTYLHLANLIIDNRGKKRGKIGRTEWGRPLGGTDLNQDAVPLRRETEVVGHAVFFTYLYAGAADAYLETGDQTLLDALQRLWRDLTEHKMYITGGVCPVHKGLSSRSDQPGKRTIRNDSVHEAAGDPYDLPNATAYNETCGQVGNMMWNWRMLFATGEARFADLMERNLYNSILSGINVTGQGWSYTNPLEWHGPQHELLSNDAHQRFDPGLRHICCPTNVLRTVASMHGYLYSTSDGALWVHHYAGNQLDTRLPDGRRIKLTETTAYPWDGHVRIVWDQIEPGQPLAILLRIPGWAQSASITVNGQPVSVKAEPASYARIQRNWQPGDALELNLPMPVRLIAANPRVEQDRQQVAVMRGPIVYCLESVDLPDAVQLEQVHLPRNATWTTQYQPDLLGGVTVLQTEGVIVPGLDPNGPLYQELPTGPPRRTALRLIPYYAWNNRGEPNMRVWLPLY